MQVAGRLIEILRAAGVDYLFGNPGTTQLPRTPPTGPVFLSLPLDLMTEPCDDRGGGAPGPVAARPAPEAEAIARAASLLAGATAPVIVAGDGVARAGAQAELVAVAELLGAAVHGEPIHRRLSVPGDHPLWRGGLYPKADRKSTRLNSSHVAIS